MNTRALILLCCFTLSLILMSKLYSAPLAPEDGSATLSRWYTTPNAFYGDKAWNEIKTALEMEGVELKLIGKSRLNYLQDVAHFDENGALLLLAPVSPDSLRGLTMAVINNEDGFWDLMRLDQEDADHHKLKSRALSWTFLEGGGVISGRFSDGSPYVILRETEVDQTITFLKEEKEESSRERALQKIAEDLEVKEENLFVLPYSNHLDLMIKALPNGKLLIQDPTLALGVLKDVKNGLYGHPTEEEKKILSEMIHVYKNEQYQNKYRNEKLYDSYSTSKEALERMIAPLLLSNKFEIVRVAGRFSRPVPFKDSTDALLMDRINFFNGFSGKSPKDGAPFFITNPSEINPLNNYWKTVLKKHLKIDDSRIHFAGRYGMGAGLDCAGSVGGK